MFFFVCVCVKNWVAPRLISAFVHSKLKVHFLTLEMLLKPGGRKCSSPIYSPFGIKLLQIVAQGLLYMLVAYDQILGWIEYFSEPSNVYK